MQQTVRRDDDLRKKSDAYVKELARDVDIHITAELYGGALPEGAIRSSYSVTDRLLAAVMRCRLGMALVKRIYQKK